MISWMLTLWACGHGVSEEVAPQRDLSERVAFATAERSEHVPITTLPAEIVPAPGGRHDVGPGVGGRLERWLVSPGDVVALGDPLAELQSPELSELDAHASQLGSAVRQGEQTVELTQAAVQRGVASTVDLRRVEAELASARAAHRAVVRQLSALRDTITRDGDRWIWRAPTSGIIDDVRCSLGGVEPGDSCLGLVASEGVVLQVAVPERHLGHLERSVTAQFIGADGRSWSFVEIGRAPAVDPRTRSRTYRFVTDAPEPPLQGMSGRARLLVSAGADLHQVSEAALTRLEGVPTVFVKTGDGTDARTVEVVGRDEGLVVVRGLRDGDEVAVRGVFLLKSLAALEEEA